MPSWSKSFLISFWSVVIGLFISLFWIAIATLILLVYLRPEVNTIFQLIEQGKLAEVIEVPGIFIVGGVIFFFIILSVISFFFVLIRYTWNEIYEEVKKELKR